VLESLGIAAAATVSSTVPQQSSKKRPLEEDEDFEEEVGHVSSAAVEAVDAAERAVKLVKAQVQASSAVRSDQSTVDDTTAHSTTT
jgi:hypothetical protein